LSDVVAQHLRRWATTDFVWGETDCLMVLADYVLDRIGVDGAAHLRGRYHDRVSCAALTGLDKGHEPVVAACCDVAGLHRTIAPIRGDIGVLRLRKLEFGGLCLGDRWAAKTLDGLMMFDRPEIVAAWAVRG
jgi:hypothetical protein